MDENVVYLCEICENGEGAYIADNHAEKVARWHCEKCEELRADFYGCARIIEEGCGCFPGPEECACGCGGTGLLEQV